MSNISQKIAKRCIARIEAQGAKGRQRERLAVDFLAGAAIAVEETKGGESPEYQQLSMATALVAIRGFSELERIAYPSARSS